MSCDLGHVGAFVCCAICWLYVKLCCIWCLLLVELARRAAMFGFAPFGCRATVGAIADWNSNLSGLGASANFVDIC